MILTPLSRAMPRSRVMPGIVIGLIALGVLLLTTVIFIFGAYSLLVYVVIGACSVVAFAAPARWGIAALVFFAGVAGVLKDIAAYETIAHLGNDIILVSLLVGHMARAANRSEPLLGDMPFKRPIALLIVASVFLTFLPLTHPIVALGGWKGYVLPALLVPVVYLGLREPGSSRPIVGAIIVTGIGNAVAAIFEQQVGPQAVGTWGPGFVRNIAFNTFSFDSANNMVWRPFGLAQDAGSAATIEAVAACVLIYLAFGKRSLTQLFAMGGALLCTIAAFNSGVRTSVLMIVVGVVGAVLVRSSTRASAILPRLVGVLIAVAVMSVAIQSSPVAIQGRVGGLLNTNTYLNGRGAVYVLLGQALVSLPLGIGMGKAVPGSELLTSLAGGVPDAGTATESMFLVMVFELGWLGMAFLLAVIWRLAGVVRAYVTKAATDREGGMAAVLLMVLFVSGLASPLIASQPGNLYLWIFATLAIMRATAWNPERDEAIVPAQE